jgi:RND family efflux transporter MFP subunit
MVKSITIDESSLRIAAWGGICLLILGVAVAGAAYLLKNGPEAYKESPEEKLGTVLVQKAALHTVQLKLRSQGEVVPRRRTAITAEVGGKLVGINPRLEAGEVFKEGELLLQIDRADYEAALAEAQATLAEANLVLEMEEVRKVQALRDWGKIGSKEEPSNLVKRVPQLASAKAKIKAAQGGVDKALRDLDRTELIAPYDCRIERTYVDAGAVVRPGVPLVDLISRGAVEVRLPFSLEDYGFLQRKEGKAIGAVTGHGRIGGKVVSWTGRMVRSEEIVERSTRSINVVVEFGDGTGSSPPIGMFVQATVTGVSIPEVVEVPRVAMLNGGEVLLVKEGRLEFRSVDVLRTEADVVLVTEGLLGGELIVLTPPNAPVPGGRVLVKEVKESPLDPALRLAPEQVPAGGAQKSKSADAPSPESE